MKNIIKYIIVLTLLVNISCASDDSNESYGEKYNSGWVEFTGVDSSFEKTINYDSGTFAIPIMLNSGTNTNGLNVTYSVELIDGNITDQSILGNKSVSIEADSKSSIINFDPILSSVFYTLKFKLIETDDIEFQAGLSDGSQPIEFTITVTNYKDYDGAPSAFGFSAPVYVTGVGKIDATHFSIKSCWGPTFVAWATGNASYTGLFLNKGIVTVNTDNTVTVTGDFIADTGSSGTYDPATGVINITFNEANLFNAGFAVNSVLTPQ